MNATRLPAGGPDDLEQLLRSELGAVADAVGSDGRPAPASAVLARGRAVRRRRRAAYAAGAAAATALVLVVGLSLGGSTTPLRTQELVPQPAGPVQTSTPLAPGALRAWARSLPSGTAPGDVLSPRSSEGIVRWDGTAVTLPAVVGRGPFATPYGRSDRGLLLSWFSASISGTEDYGMQLGWLSPDARSWVPVETVVVTGAWLSPDGSRYAYTGDVRDGATSKVTRELVVRRTRDDRVVARTQVSGERFLLGWLQGRPALRDQQGSQLFTYDPSSLAPTGDVLVRLTPDPGPGRFTGIFGSTLQYLTDGGCEQTEQTGPMAVHHAVVLGADGTSSFVELGCAPEDLQFLSPDGRWVVRPGDEATIRSATTGRPVGALHPTGWPVGTVAVWEPDGGHVRVVGDLGPQGAGATIVRCAVADGTCVRLQ